jgi:hypothetical protein
MIKIINNKGPYKGLSRELIGTIATATAAEELKKANESDLNILINTLTACAIYLGISTFDDLIDLLKYYGVIKKRKFNVVETQTIHDITSGEKTISLRQLQNLNNAVTAIENANLNKKEVKYKISKRIFDNSSHQVIKGNATLQTMMTATPVCITLCLALFGNRVEIPQDQIRDVALGSGIICIPFLKRGIKNMQIFDGAQVTIANHIKPDSNTMEALKRIKNNEPINIDELREVRETLTTIIDEESKDKKNDVIKIKVNKRKK